MEIPVTLVPSIDAQAKPSWPSTPTSPRAKKAQKAGGLCLALKGVPVKPTANVDFSADGKEFAGVNLNATPKEKTTDYVDFVPTLGKTAVTGSADDILILGPDNTLFNPLFTSDAESRNMKGFRAYFQLNSVSGAAPRAFVLDLGDDQATGIISLTLDPSPKGEGGIYTLDGRRINGEPTQKGVYIKNGKKVIIK